MKELTVNDIYDVVLPKLQALRIAWDRERVSRPDLYGPAPRSIWLRLKREYRRKAKLRVQSWR